MMKISKNKRTATKIIFGLISAALLMWTAYLTVSFLSVALPGAFWLAPYLGLVVFDAGMIGWLFVYLYLAEGAMQRTIALGLTVFNLLGVGLMTIAEIVLGGQTLTAAPEGLGTAAIWGVGGWTFVNVAAIVAFHLSSPDARIAAAIQDEKDAVVDLALQDLTARREQNALALSQDMSAGMYNTLVNELASDTDGDGVPDIYERKANRGKRDAPTHDAPRHDADTTPTAAAPGQGATPRLHPDDVAAIAAVVAQMSAPVPSPNGQEVKPGNP
jgi:hypothetical protein